MARNTGKREPTAGPLTRPRNRRAASATAGHRPASLCWQAQRAATAGRAGQGWPGGGGLALSRAATEPNRRAWNGHPGFRARAEMPQSAIFRGETLLSFFKLA